MDSEPKICRTCRHLAERPTPVHFGPAQYRSTGVLDADLKWQERRRTIGLGEQSRVNAGLPFLYEPFTYAWCRLLTAERGTGSVDPVSGEPVTVYVICHTANRSGNCAHHTPICEDPIP